MIKCRYIEIRDCLELQRGQVSNYKKNVKIPIRRDRGGVYKKANSKQRREIRDNS